MRLVGANTPSLSTPKDGALTPSLSATKAGALSARTEKLHARRVRGGNDADRGDGEEAGKHHGCGGRTKSSEGGTTGQISGGKLFNAGNLVKID